VSFSFFLFLLYPLVCFFSLPTCVFFSFFTLWHAGLFCSICVGGGGWDDKRMLDVSVGGIGRGGDGETEREAMRD